MSRSDGERLADVMHLVGAAREVVSRRAQWADEIARTTGLSPEGVELGFTRHLEIDATEADVARLVADASRFGDPGAVYVILSANVFVAPLRAIAIARAASARVVVRPSRREPTFARALAFVARDPAITLASDVAYEAIESGEVHVYGRNETIAELRARTPAGVGVRGHGAGMGVAILTRDADLGASAALLANDVVAFDQRGCLSPRIALVEGGDARASVLGDALDVALTALGRQVPRGRLDDDERASAARYVEALAFAGRVFRGDDHVVGLAPEGAPLVVPPAGRHVHIASFADLDALERALAPFARFIVAVGTNDAPRVAGVVPAHARLSPLGAMQRPPFDGPVDRRVALVTAA